MANQLAFLLNLGFERTATWHRGLSGKLSCRIAQHADKREILYAFVVGEEVTYIGKSTRTLKQRMYGYQNPGPTQRTNIKNHAKIIEALDQGKTVGIYVFVQREPVVYRGIPVNLAAGLEDVLIEWLRPPWNSLGK